MSSACHRIWRRTSRDQSVGLGPETLPDAWAGANCPAKEAPMVHAARVAIPMTVEEFRDWVGRQPGRWELADGQPRAMAPASATHGLIQARATYLVERHLADTGSPCRAATEAPVLPASFKRHNARVPDLSVTCSPQAED